eukprot:6890813-Prorocentrum_lima.AAC.1
MCTTVSCVALWRCNICVGLIVIAAWCTLSSSCWCGVSVVVSFCTGDQGVGIVGLSTIGGVPGPQCMCCTSCSCCALCPICQMVLGRILCLLGSCASCVRSSSPRVLVVVVVVGLSLWWCGRSGFGSGVGCADAIVLAH